MKKQTRTDDKITIKEYELILAVLKHLSKDWKPETPLKYLLDRYTELSRFIEYKRSLHNKRK